MAERLSHQDLQRRVDALEAELAATRASLQEFTYAVSHDLRAPLRHLVSFAQLLEEEAGSQLQGESADFLRTISASARHMGELLDALTGLSRIDGLPVQWSDIALEPLLKDAWAQVQATDPARDVPVEWSIPAGAVLSTDPQLLRQAVLQVLGNAFKFTARTPQPQVQVTVDLEPGGDLVCRVVDNGAGFNPAMQDKLFKVFGRLHTAKQFPGLGVGLLTAQRLLHNVGARVSLTATAPCGAVAEIRFQGTKESPTERV